MGPPYPWVFGSRLHRVSTTGIRNFMNMLGTTAVYLENIHSGIVIYVEPLKASTGLCLSWPLHASEMSTEATCFWKQTRGCQPRRLKYLESLIVQSYPILNRVIGCSDAKMATSVPCSPMEVAKAEGEAFVPFPSLRAQSPQRGKFSCFPGCFPWSCFSGCFVACHGV